MQRYFLILFLILYGTGVYAQQSAYRFNRDVLSLSEVKMNDKRVEAHPNIQPMAIGLESTLFTNRDTTDTSSNQKNSLCAGLLLSGSGGYQFTDQSTPVYGGLVGLDLSLNQVKQWSANIGYALVGGSPPEYLRNLADSLHVIPGAGYAVNDGNDLYHTHYTYGHLSYSNGKHFHFEIGKGKHFWGDGYRSMILGDNANAFPYARITTKVWKLKYTNLWMQLRDLSYTKKLKSARIKYAAMHALSLNMGKRFNISLYEMVVWQDRDTMSTRTLDINYLNPIIFYRPIEYSLGSPDNVILAMSMRYKPFAKLQFYGQFLLDEFNLEQFRGNKKWWANKLGGQFGVKIFDIIPGLSFQSEGNIARPFTYTHGSPIQSWTHLNQSLAHPMGSNFIEWVNFIRFDYQGWTIREQFTWAAFGRDRDMDGDGLIDNLGGNILRSYKDPYGKYGHEMLQGLKSTFLYHSLTISKRIEKLNGYELFLSHTMRYEKNEIGKVSDHFLIVGLRVSGLLQPGTDF